MAFGLMHAQAAFSPRVDRLSSAPDWNVVEAAACKSESRVSAPWAAPLRPGCMEVGHQVTVWNRTAAKTKPLADAGAKLAASPTALAAACEAIITILTDGAAIEAVYNGPSGLSGRRRERQVVHRDEHGAAGRGDRAGAKGAGQGRRVRRMPGRRLDRAGAPGQAARADGRRARRCCARQADPRTALPQGRALRSGRRRLVDETCDQSAADGRPGRPMAKRSPSRATSAGSPSGCSICSSKATAPIMG